MESVNENGDPAFALRGYGGQAENGLRVKRISQPAYNAMLACASKRSIAGRSYAVLSLPAILCGRSEAKTQARSDGRVAHYQPARF